MTPDQLHTTLLLAQDGPPAPGEASGVTGAPGVTGTPGGPAGGTTTNPGPGLGPFAILLPIVLIFIVFSMMGQRRDKKKRDSMIKQIKKHDRVQTIGGVLGSVVEVKPNTVVLKVDESSNTRITFARSSIQQVVDANVDSDLATDKES